MAFLGRVGNRLFPDTASEMKKVPTPLGVYDLGRQILNGVIDLIYPPSCFMCGCGTSSDANGFCSICTEELTADASLSCPRCGMTIGPYTPGSDCPSCRKALFHFD